MSAIATIGIYGFDGGSFLTTLAEAQVDLVLDVRQRRGVRRSEYAWANSRRSQAALAPATELRQLQYREDARLGGLAGASAHGRCWLPNTSASIPSLKQAWMHDSAGF